MTAHTKLARKSSLAAVLGLAMAAVLADWSAGHVILASEPQQAVPGNPGAGGAPATPKTDASKAPAATPKSAADAPSALPRAGSNSQSSGARPGASDNPFKPHSADMLRQSNRLKMKGYSANVMNDAEIVQALSASTKLLAKIDDDYLGHRTKAIQEVEAAMRQIKTKAGKAGAKSTTAPHGDSKVSLTRTESDALLREAQKSLERIVFQINHGGNVKNLAPARNSVQKAIDELNSALNVR